jgi:hypothetical protein
MSKTYNCNVLNCGNGKCVHKLTDEICPFCRLNLVEVTTTGYKFCSNILSICDYEKFDDIHELQPPLQPVSICYNFKNN